MFVHKNKLNIYAVMFEIIHDYFKFIQAEKEKTNLQDNKFQVSTDK